jgi:hypothetical protein
MILAGKGTVAGAPTMTDYIHVPGSIVFETNMAIYAEEGDFASVQVFYQR